MSIAQADTLLTAPGAPFELEERLIDGVATPVYKHAPKSLRDIFLEGRTWGARTFLVYEHDRVSYANHYVAACHLAHALIAQYRIRPGDRVAIVMRNCPQWSAAFHAAMLVGAVATPLNAWWTGEELAQGLADCGARLAIVDPERAALIRATRAETPALEHILTARATSATTSEAQLEDLIGGARDWAYLSDAAPPAIPLDADDPAAIMYTSGTSGRARGVVATHRNIISAIWNTAACKARSFLREGRRPPEPSIEDPPQVSLMSTPLFHATACFTGLIPAQLSGAKLVFQRKFDAGAALKLIQDEGVTQLGGVPTIVEMLIDHPDRPKTDLSSVKMVGYGGAPSSPDLAARIKDVFPFAAPANGWGMTETCATITLNYGEDYALRPDSAGAPAPAARIRVVDEAGAPLGVGEVGELEASGPNTARRYWNDPEAAAQTFADGWVRTGDLATIDEEGFLRIVDRKKDMIIRGGENIYSIEVETALATHPDVAEAGVVGLPHPSLGEIIAAVVHLRPDATPGPALDDALRLHVAARLAAFKVPARFNFTRAPLPRNANGKILKADLKAMFEDGGDDQRRQETGGDDARRTG